jgi:Fungal Zn(2)-Cys(6) binuclear cluster domain
MMLINYRAQHVRCDGIRPVCKRCQGRGHACIYAPKRSPWTIYTGVGKESSRETDDVLTPSHPTSATSFPGTHTESVLDASVTPDSTMLASKSGLPVLRHVSTTVLDTYKSNQLHSSPDTVPSHWNWSDIRVDVHALMNFCKTGTQIEETER